jgi:hypothetical protein
MKRVIVIGVLIFAAAFAGTWLGNVAHAQTAAIPAQITVVGTHTQCTATPAATPAHADICFAADGIWLSINGAAFTQLGAASAVGVTSFNGRTGAVVPSANDYTYSQLASPPTTINCGAAGCAIK